MARLVVLAVLLWASCVGRPQGQQRVDRGSTVWL
jgi:hypothetical protein